MDHIKLVQLNLKYILALQKELFHAMDVRRAAALLEHMPADERADFYVLLDAETQQKLLSSPAFMR